MSSFLFIYSIRSKLYGDVRGKALAEVDEENNEEEEEGAGTSVEEEDALSFETTDISHQDPSCRIRKHFDFGLRSYCAQEESSEGGDDETDDEADELEACEGGVEATVSLLCSTAGDAGPPVVRLLVRKINILLFVNYRGGHFRYC